AESPSVQRFTVFSPSDFFYGARPWLVPGVCHSSCPARAYRRGSIRFVLIARTARRRRARDRRTASRPSSSRPGAAGSQDPASTPKGRGRRRAIGRSVPARGRSPAANRGDETPSLHAVTEPLSEQAENAWLSCVVALCYCVHYLHCNTP